MIAMSPITGRIYSGRANKSLTSWEGAKKDVTSDVLKAVIEKAQYHGGSFDIEGSDGSKYVLTVTKEELAND